MKRVVLADSHEVFRIGIAKTICMTDEFRVVARCSDSTKLLQAITAFPGCIAVVAASLNVDLRSVRHCLERTASKGIIIVECQSSLDHLSETFLGIITRDISAAALRECIREVRYGRSWIARELADCMPSPQDAVGERVRDRLTPREMRVAALLLQGHKNREISIRLGATEQAIKNSFRSMYEKSGAGDRLEMALFIHQHQILAQAVAATAKDMKAEELYAAYSTAVA